MSGKWSKQFWGDLGERVGATFIATLIPVYVTAANVASLDWVNAVEISASAAGLSLLKALLVNLGGGAAPSASVVGVTSTYSPAAPDAKDAA